MKNYQPGKEANNIENQNENKKKDMSRLFQAIEVSDANWVKENLQRGDSLEQIDKYYGSSVHIMPN